MDRHTFYFLITCWWFIRGCAPEIMFVGLPGTARLAENSPAGTQVYSFQLVLSPGASLPAAYPRILNSDPLTTAFMVSLHNTTHAMVSVTGTAELNFETAPNHFALQILAVDTEEYSDLQILTVILTDVDEPPIFLDKESVLYVLEKTPPKEIYTPSVADPEDKPLIFKLVPPIPEFDVDANSGALFTTKEFNYQTDPRSFALDLSVNDGNNTVSRAIIVNIMNIHDDKPQFLNKITSFAVREEMSPGGFVTNITAVVPDTSSYTGFIFYTINANSYLTINRYTGQVTIASKMDRDSSPLRENHIFSVTVTATFSPPGPPLSNTITLEITVEDINDNPPICFPGAQRVEILETATVGALITTVTCTDNDVDPAFSEHQITGLSCQGCDLRFALDPPAPGSNSIVLNGNLDFEDPDNMFGRSEYSLSVVAEDKDDPTLKGSTYVFVTVTPVNEFPPVFAPTSYFYRISELLGRGAVFGAVQATDADLPPTVIQYSIISGGVGDSVFSNIFFLDPKLGSISLLTRPDYETKQTYNLVIRATDGDRFATTVVTINITEANDEPPLCGPNKTNLVVAKDLRTGSVVQGFQLSCKDLDSPPSSFIYSISGASNLNNHFVFSPSSGTNLTRLILREPFDFESGLDRVWHYHLTVLVSDGNLRAGEPKVRDPIQTGTVIINIQVVDPYLTTVITTTTPRVTYITLTENTFSWDDWYVWFLVALGAMLLLGILGYLLYHCCRWLFTLDYSCCQNQPTPVEDTEVLIPETAPQKREVLVEVTKINTVFDGEEVDPVTKRIYEFNSKSGARRWKDTSIISELPATQQQSSTFVITGGANGTRLHSGLGQSLAGTERERTGGVQLHTRSEGEGSASKVPGQTPRESPLYNMSRHPSGRSTQSPAHSGVRRPYGGDLMKNMGPSDMSEV